MKNILVLSTSLRVEGNSDMLAQAFVDGAKNAGHKVEKISLSGKMIHFCRGCLACQKTQACVIKDDASEIVKEMLHADVIVFATPIYFYEMSGQMKTLLDRTNPIFSLDYQFRDIYLLTSAAEEEDAAMRRAVMGLEGWIDCFEKAQLKGTIFAGGVTGVGDIAGNAVLEKAYHMGAAIENDVIG